MKVFGERLRDLRIKRNLTQEELGGIFNPPLSQSTVGTYENGKRQPTLENLAFLSRYFSVTTDYLLGLTDEIVVAKDEDPKELKEFLKKNDILFNGSELNENEKQRIVDILTGLFWNHFTNKN